jgi:hypothetical protein
LKVSGVDAAALGANCDMNAEWTAVWIADMSLQQKIWQIGRDRYGNISTSHNNIR